MISLSTLVMCGYLVSVRRWPSGQECKWKPCSVLWTPTIVSTWSDDGHIHSTCHSEAAVPGTGREAADCGRDVGGGRVGSADSAGAWSQRQPGFQLAQAVSSGAAVWPRRSQAVARQS